MATGKRRAKGVALEPAGCQCGAPPGCGKNALRGSKGQSLGCCREHFTEMCLDAEPADLEFVTDLLLDQAEAERLKQVVQAELAERARKAQDRRSSATAGLGADTGGGVFLPGDGDGDEEGGGDGDESEVESEVARGDTPCEDADEGGDEDEEGGGEDEGGGEEEDWEGEEEEWQEEGDWEEEEGPTGQETRWCAAR